MNKIYTSKEKPYEYYGQKSYRIEIDITDPLRHYQRHIWTDNKGQIDVEDWIPTFKETHESLLKQGYKLKDLKNDLDEVIEETHKRIASTKKIIEENLGDRNKRQNQKEYKKNENQNKIRLLGIR